MYTLIINKPYVVQQTDGHELGYNILEYNKIKDKNKEIDLMGYKIKFNPHINDSNIKLVDNDGKLYPGSIREIRLIKGVNIYQLLFLSAMLPFSIWFLIFLIRKYRMYLPMYLKREKQNFIWHP